MREISVDEIDQVNGGLVVAAILLAPVELSVAAAVGVAAVGIGLGYAIDKALGVI